LVRNLPHDNRKRGKDRKPSSYHLQQAVLFVEAASATLLWLMRDKKKELKFPNWELPFKIAGRIVGRAAILKTIEL